MKKWHGCGTCPCSTHVQKLHHLYIIYISSGKLTVCYWKWFIKSLTVDLLYLFQMVIFHSYVSLPEGYTSLLWRNVQYHVAWSEFNLLSPVDHTHAAIPISCFAGCPHQPTVRFGWPVPMNHRKKTSRILMIRICSMYGIFANICPKKHPNVGKYTIHWAYGISPCSSINSST